MLFVHQPFYFNVKQNNELTMNVSNFEKHLKSILIKIQTRQYLIDVLKEPEPPL